MYEFKSIKDYISKNDIEFIYIRYIHTASYGYLKFLKELKKMGVLIIMEIPTYPYDKEYKKSFTLRYFKFLYEKMARKYLGRYVDRIVTFSKDDYIFNSPTIKISNGINIDRIKEKKKTKKNKGEINLIGVAGLAFYHGYDRMIKSIAEYYKSNPQDSIKFHIVGEGPIKKDLEQLSKDLGVETKVIFYGAKSGEALEAIFDKCDIGVGCLGCHRKGLTQVSSLKNVEYCAKGIPFIYSEENKDFDKMDFVCKISPNEDLIDINKIISFYNNLKISSQEIREFSKRLTWDTQMDIVVNQIEKMR